MINKIRDHIIRHALIETGDRLLLSLSAGKDSMALLAAMRHLKDEWRLDLAIFHLNHLMRGGESDADEDYIRRLGVDCGLTVFIERFDFRANPSPGKSFEEHARDRRYALLDSIAREHHYNRIATAHNRDDCAETVLYRIFTGTGVYGLRGIPPRRGSIIRPLLSCDSAEIYSFLRQQDIAWREDSSNADTGYSRNFIRHRLHPVISERFPRYRDALESLSAVAADYAVIIDSLLTGQYGAFTRADGDDLIIDIGPYLCHERIFLYVLAKALRDWRGISVSTGMLHESYRRFMIGRTHIILYRRDDIAVVKGIHRGLPAIRLSRAIAPDPPADWEYRFGCPLDSIADRYIPEIGRRIVCEPVSYRDFREKTRPGALYVGIDDPAALLFVRNRRPGDRMVTEAGTKKLKDILIENKLDNITKNRVPLIVIGNSIAAFAPGLLTDKPNRVSPEFWVRTESKKILALYACEDVYLYE